VTLLYRAKPAFVSLYDIYFFRLLGLDTHYLSRYLDHETTKWRFRSSSQAATCYYQSNHSKVEG